MNQINTEVKINDEILFGDKPKRLITKEQLIGHINNLLDKTNYDLNNYTVLPNKIRYVDINFILRYLQQVEDGDTNATR